MKEFERGRPWHPLRSATALDLEKWKSTWKSMEFCPPGQAMSYYKNMVHCTYYFSAAVLTEVSTSSSASRCAEVTSERRPSS